MISSVYFTFSILNPLFIGFVRPRLLPVCSEEVDSVSHIGQDIFAHGLLSQGAHMILRMLICCFRDRIRLKLQQTYCVSSVGMFHHKGMTQRLQSSQSRTWSISRIRMFFLGLVEVLLFSVFSIFSFTLWSVSSKPHNPHNQDILLPVLPQWTLSTTRPPGRGSLPKPRIPCKIL